MEGFSEMEVSIVTNMMHTRSYKDIAGVLDRTKEEIASLVATLIEGTDIVPHQVTLTAREAGKPPRVRVRKPKAPSAEKIKKVNQEKLDRENKKRESKANQQERLRVERERAKARAEARGMYVTKQVDYTKLHMVKVCKGTYIYVKPGESEQQAIDRYYGTYKKPTLG